MDFNVSRRSTHELLLSESGRPYTLAYYMKYIVGRNFPCTILISLIRLKVELNHSETVDNDRPYAHTHTDNTLT
jgi:hypothetical protein